SFAIELGRTVVDPTTNATLLGSIDTRDKLIIVAKTAAATVFFHEVGHGLQSDAPSLLDFGWRSYEALRAGQIDEISERTYRYLSSQHEFETMLQDLNRLFATMVAKAPIMSPHDSVRALDAIGMPLDYEEVRDAFAAEG